MPTSCSIVWFRQDLRLEDNLALLAALEHSSHIIPVYIWTPEEEGQWAIGGASKWWLHYSLKEFESHLKQLGSKLIIRQGHALQVLKELVQETQSNSIYWNRRYEPEITERDTRIKAFFRQIGITCESFNSALLFEPWEIKTKQASPFQVFTPFWKTILLGPEPSEPFKAPSALPPVSSDVRSISLDDLKLKSSIDWAHGFRATWQPGETGAHLMLEKFIQKKFPDYIDTRDRPDLSSTSCISPHLHFGEISPRRIWHRVKHHVLSIESKSALEKEMPHLKRSAEAFLRQLGWREFGYHLLYFFPHTPQEPLRTPYRSFPWKNDPIHLHAWQKGLTGFPIVDAGMRELWATGWMHNRVRMITASFLVKDLLIPWTEGAKWFWDTLVDADLANNTLGWQWTAGCGADAAPYFRIFNPVIQGEKFDPEGHYVRKWVPELAKLTNKYVHKPWEASSLELKSADIVLGKTYPFSIIDHAEARDRALRAFDYIRGDCKSRFGDQI